jgi:hypothetical protein
MSARAAPMPPVEQPVMRTDFGRVGMLGGDVGLDLEFGKVEAFYTHQNQTWQHAHPPNAISPTTFPDEVTCAIHHACSRRACLHTTLPETEYKKGLAN